MDDLGGKPTIFGNIQMCLEFSCLLLIWWPSCIHWCDVCSSIGCHTRNVLVRSVCLQNEPRQIGVCKFLMAEWVKVEVYKFIVNDKLYTYICDIYKFYRFSLQDSYIWQNIYDFSKFFASLGSYKSSAWWSKGIMKEATREQVVFKTECRCHLSLFSSMIFTKVIFV